MPVTEQKIIDAYLKYAPKWDHKNIDINSIIDRFDPDEIPEGVVDAGLLGYKYGDIAITGYGFLVITNQRVFYCFTYSNLFQKRKAEGVDSYPFHNLISVEFTSSTISLTTYQGKYSFSVVDKKCDHRAFVRDAKKKLEIQKSISQTTGGQGFLNQLERLARLKEQGMLTAEEFTKAKAKLLL